jgi:hypothetical protein
MARKAKAVRETIRAIESATETPELTRLDQEPGAKPPTAARTKAPLKVFILAGQSNMQGHAGVNTFDSLAADPKTAPLLKEMRGPDGKPRVCENVWISSVGCLGDAYSDLTEAKGRLTAGFGAPENKIGPEFTFGLTMEQRIKAPVLIIKTSWGGRSLHTDFRPPSAGPFVLAKETQELWDKHPEGAHGIPRLQDRPKFHAENSPASFGSKGSTTTSTAESTPGRTSPEATTSTPTCSATSSATCAKTSRPRSCRSSSASWASTVFEATTSPR